MNRRLDQARDALERAWAAWHRGEAAEMYDSRDLAAWYILQADTFARDRRWIVPDEIARIVPYFAKIGAEFDQLVAIPAAEERAARFMNGERSQPDAGIYELLVALAYARHGWTVDFVPENRGGPRTPDLMARRRSSRWAIECKRMARSGYANTERLQGRLLAAPLHRWCSEHGLSLVIEVFYQIPLRDVPEDYLERSAPAAFQTPFRNWRDEIAFGRVRLVDWELAEGVFEHDDVFFGSSRFVELLSGEYHHAADHSVAADWTPSPARAAFASSVRQASVVSWWSLSEEAERSKAQFFRRQLANAEGQLPADRPGVVHVGIETGAAMPVERRRHLLNLLEARSFVPANSRLRWIYANIFVPEVTTHPNEAWAFTETMVPYRIGRHRTSWPLPGHLIVTPEEGAGAGVHW